MVNDPEAVFLDEALVGFDGLLLFEDEDREFDEASERLFDRRDFLSTIVRVEI